MYLSLPQLTDPPNHGASATAAMREGRMLRMFTGLIAGCCFALAAFACFFLGRALATLPQNNLFLALTESVALACAERFEDSARISPLTALDTDTGAGIG